MRVLVAVTLTLAAGTITIRVFDALRAAVVDLEGVSDAEGDFDSEDEREVVRDCDTARDGDDDAVGERDGVLSGVTDSVCVTEPTDLDAVGLRVWLGKNCPCRRRSCCTPLCSESKSPSSSVAGDRAAKAASVTASSA